MITKHNNKMQVYHISWTVGPYRVVALFYISGLGEWKAISTYKVIPVLQTTFTILQTTHTIQKVKRKLL